MDKSLMAAIKYGCYHSSYIQTSSVVLMQMVHRQLRTWDNWVSIFIAPTQYVRNWFIDAGIPSEKIIVKPHFVYPIDKTTTPFQEYALFLGRLARNKGIIELLEAWGSIDFPLKIVGGGVLEGEVQQYLQNRKLSNVKLHGQVSNERALGYIANASFLIVPSIHYEAFARVVVEAFSCGIPVIASRRPPLTELIDHGRNGLLFDPDDEQEFVSTIRWLLSHKSEAKRMGIQAKQDFNSRFSAETNYEHLIDIYEHAMHH